MWPLKENSLLSENLMPSKDFIDRIPLAQDQKTALLFAFYNTIFFALFGVCLVGLFAIYQLLYMFLTPILWAVLVGTVLFPFKKRVSVHFKEWLEGLNEENRPLAIGIAFLPIQLIHDISDYIYETALSSTGALSLLGYIVLKVLCYEDVFLTLLSWIGCFYSLMNSSISFFTQKWVMALLIIYSCAFGGWIFVQELQNIPKKLARTLSLPIWFFVIAHVANLFGPFRVFAFTSAAALLILLSAGLIAADGEESSKEHESKPLKNETQSEKNLEEVEGWKTAREQSLATDVSVRGPAPPTPDRTMEELGLDKALSGDNHLRIIGALCFLLFTVHHDAVLILIFLLFLVAMFFKSGERLGIHHTFCNFVQCLWQCCRDTVEKFVNIIVAGSLRKFVKLLFTSDRMFVAGLTSKVDVISSIAVMAFLAIGSVFFAMFMAFQVHNETVHLIKLGGNVVSSNPDWLKFARNYTEGQIRDHDIDDYIELAYQQGRKWLAANIRSLADPKDTSRADHLEDQAKFLVDNLYRMWEERSFEYTNVSAKTSIISSQGYQDWFAQIVSASNLETLKGELTNIISANIETVLSIMQSLWTIVLMNVSLLSTVLGSILSLVLGLGFDLLNFFIEIIVFNTAVYYLLANSSTQWLPLKWFNDLLTSIQLTTDSGSFQKVRIVGAVENAISGVFVLSAKMSIFYGLYTYFVHSLFDLNVVFVPSMLAAIFAAIPIVPPYLVGIFGFVELFLVRGETVAGIIFAITSIAPVMFADKAFYQEIEGSHPYVTGLAVIGGLYWLGLQGAIIGPIILCCMIAMINLYTEFAKSN